MVKIFPPKDLEKIQAIKIRMRRFFFFLIYIYFTNKKYFFACEVS